jgi:hypothetical protein
MDHQRIRDAAMGRKGDLEARLNRRVRVYTVAAVVLGLFYVFGGGAGDDAPLERASKPLDPVDLPIDVPPLAKVDPTLLQGVVDGTPAERAVLESAPLRHLMLQAGRLVYGDLPRLGLLPGDWDALVSEPAAHRGAPFWARGTLQWIEQEMVDGYLEVRGEVRDRAGQPWGFLVVTEPYRAVPGDVVKLSGFFMKSHDLLRPDGSQVTVPLLVGDEILQSAYPMDPVTSLDSARFDGVRDADLAEASAPLESPEYWELLSYVDNTSVDTLFPPDEPLPTMLPTELLTRPWAHRAQPVTLTGVLYYMTEAPLGHRGENPLGIPFVWELWISDNRAGQAGTIHAVSIGRPEGLEEGDIVEVDGLFFRRQAFENKRNQPRMAAAVVAKRVRPLIPEPDTLTPALVRVVTGLVGVVVLLIVLGQWRERRASATARSRRMRRHQGNVARPGLLAAGGEGPAQGGEGDGGSQGGPDNSPDGEGRSTDADAPTDAGAPTGASDDDESDDGREPSGPDKPGPAGGPSAPTAPPGDGDPPPKSTVW